MNMLSSIIFNQVMLNMGVHTWPLRVAEVSVLVAGRVSAPITLSESMLSAVIPAPTKLYQPQTRRKVSMDLFWFWEKTRQFFSSCPNIPSTQGT